MAKPTEHKTVQDRILAYAEAIGWAFVSQKEAEKRRGIGDSKLEIGKGSLFFEDLLDAKVREFNPRYAEAEGRLRRRIWFELLTGRNCLHERN